MTTIINAAVRATSVGTPSLGSRMRAGFSQAWRSTPGAIEVLQGLDAVQRAEVVQLLVRMPVYENLMFSAARYV